MSAVSSSGKVGLACAGGVVEGAFYEVGVLCALEDAIGGLDLNSLDAYVGVSAGALVTSCLANGIPPKTMARAIIHREDPVLNLRPEVLFAPALGEHARRARQFPGALLGAVGQYLRHPLDSTLFGALTSLGSTMPVGFFTNAPLERYLDRVFATGGRTNDFRELPTSLRVVAVNLDTSELVAFGDEETEQVPISRAVQASTALPVLYCPVEIDGQYYIDGVARRTLNASQALSEGVDLLFCINPIVPVDLRAARTGEDGLRRSLVEYGLPAVLSQTFRTVIHSRMRSGFKNYEYAFPEADVVLIEPGLHDHSMFFSNIFSFGNRYRACEHGYRTTLEFLRREGERLRPTLERHGLRLRPDVLADATRTLFTTAELEPRARSRRRKKDAATHDRLTPAPGRLATEAP